MTYKEWFQTIVAQYTIGELEQICKGLNKVYNIYDPENIRWKKIAYYFFKTKVTDLDSLSKTVLSNQFINDLFLRYYVCERVVKYYLIKKLIGLTDDIVAFEMSVGDSRIDVCRINGGSYAYEIKTQYDSFDRLENQMRDYLKAFEKVYVVVPYTRVSSIQSFIPCECGIISYRQASNYELVFSYYRRSIKTQCDVNFCLSNLSSRDLSDFLRMAKMNSAGSKSEKLAAILQYSNNHNIWPIYRQLLKAKYKPSWLFIKDHFSEILPIDIQSFFASTMSPVLLYEAKKEHS